MGPPRALPPKRHLEGHPTLPRSSAPTSSSTPKSAAKACGRDRSPARDRGVGWELCDVLPHQSQPHSPVLASGRQHHYLEFGHFSRAPRRPQASWRGVREPQEVVCPQSFWNSLRVVPGWFTRSCGEERRRATKQAGQSSELGPAQQAGVLCMSRVALGPATHFLTWKAGIKTHTSLGSCEH